jgi:hypothetical protein
MEFYRHCIFRLCARPASAVAIFGRRTVLCSGLSGSLKIWETVVQCYKLLIVALVYDAVHRLCRICLIGQIKERRTLSCGYSLSSSSFDLKLFDIFF